jgi:hypothetical protein
MNNNCWYKLNIDISHALRKDWTWEIPDLSKLNIMIKGRQIFNQDWLEYMNSIDIPINYVMLFYRNSRLPMTNAHVDVIRWDGISLNSIFCVPYALNWVLDGEDSKMIWYNLPQINPIIKHTVANTPYLDWPVETLTEIDQCEIKNSLTLVRTDIQ